MVYTNGDKTVSEPLIVQAALKHNASAIYVEATRTTASYAEEIDKRIRSTGNRMNIITTTKHWTGTGKAQRIFDKAPEIKERMVFLDSNNRSKEYNKFMQNVYSFTIEGKNKHDDAPDSLAMILANINRKPQTIKVYDSKGIL